MKHLNLNAEFNQKPIEILLVEDDFALRTQIVKLLKRNGIKVTTAENGIVAKDFFVETPDKFDLIISDIQMAGLNGLELLNYIRANSSIPFIAMTGSSDQIDTNNAYAKGATEFLPKPVSTEALLEAISHALNPPPTQVAR